MKKQTAVMILLKQMDREKYLTNVPFYQFAQKYLEMEKEQIMEAYRQGVQDCPKHNLGEIIRKEQYYNETYNQP